MFGLKGFGANDAEEFVFIRLNNLATVLVRLVIKGDIVVGR